MKRGRDETDNRRAIHIAKRKPLISPLTRRILTVNLIALGILVAGLLYLGEYRRSLIKNELASLQVQAEMFAAALGEGAVAADTPEGRFLVSDIAYQITRRLAQTTGTRARLFRVDGALIVDSRRLVGVAGGTVQIEVLAPPDFNSNVLTYILNQYERLARKVRSEEKLPKYHEPPLQTADSYSEAAAALQGDSAVAARRFGRSGLILSAGVPVQRYKQILGSLMLSRDGKSIEDAVYDVRLDILKVVIVAMMITVLLSLYLAGTIARPIRQLAEAAERIRHDHGRGTTIPDQTRRNDEIGDLAASLRDMTEALWLRMDAIERFAADVSHEIKNPLTSLRSAVETAGRIEDPEKRARLMAIIKDDVARLDRLISDISDASRLDAELSRTELVPVNLSKLIGTLAEIHNATTDGARVPIRFEIISDIDTTVNGIEDRLVQVFRNLIANAVTFSPDGSDIVINLSRENGYLMITVDDAGPGIPRGAETEIFNRFYTSRPDGEKFGTHSGLGLAISKQIIDTHNGTISAINRRTSDGRVSGAGFIIQLPVGNA